MLLSSPRTRSIKTITPALVFAGSTIGVLLAQRNTLLSDPVSTLILLIAVYGCAAWVVWRPWRLKVADQVEDRANMLFIRRGNVEVEVPYSAVRRHEYLRIGNNAGVKLIFSEPNKLASEIGFYITADVNGAGMPSEDPIWHMERQIEMSRHGRAV